MRNFYLTLILTGIFCGMVISANAGDMTIEMLNKKARENAI